MTKIPVLTEEQSKLKLKALKIAVNTWQKKFGTGRELPDEEYDHALIVFGRVGNWDAKKQTVDTRIMFLGAWGPKLLQGTIRLIYEDGMKSIVRALLGR